MRALRRLQDRASFAITPTAVLIFAAGKDTGSGVPTITPDKTKAPGAAGLTDAINGFAFYALLAASAGFLLGLIVWGVGGRIGNDYAATGGKVGAASSLAVAFLVGGATAILSFAYGAGGT